MCLVVQNYQQPQLKYETSISFSLSEIIPEFVIFYFGNTDMSAPNTE